MMDVSIHDKPSSGETKPYAAPVFDSRPMATTTIMEPRTHSRRPNLSPPVPSLASTVGRIDHKVPSFVVIYTYTLPVPLLPCISAPTAITSSCNETPMPNLSSVATSMGVRKAVLLHDSPSSLVSYTMIRPLPLDHPKHDNTKRSPHRGTCAPH